MAREMPWIRQFLFSNDGALILITEKSHYWALRKLNKVTNGNIDEWATEGSGIGSALIEKHFKTRKAGE